MTLSRLLVGQPFFQDKYAPTGLQESQLHDFDMGYYTLTEKDPFRSINWIPEENAFTHQYSLEEIGRVYAFNKLQDYIPLELYLTLPNVIVDDLITGLVNGRNERHEYDEAERKKRQKEEPSKTEDDLNELLKRVDKLAGD